jgi:hypothetical protein
MGRRGLKLDLNKKLNGFNVLTMKKTLGEEGARGVIYDPRGNREFDFYWNIGITSNNKVGAYALYQGVQLEKK